MFLNRLQVQQYRNYNHIDLSFHSSLNIFLGKNAQGKTNLLESIYLLSLGKSHRTYKDKELIQWDKETSNIKGFIEKKYGKLQLDILLTGKGKKVSLNGIEKKRLSEFIGNLNVVMFAPEDLTIVKGTPQIRRKFLDMEIGQIHPIYIHHLSNFNKIVHQKNQFLKNSFGKSINHALMDIWNQQLVSVAVPILKKRLFFLKKLETYANDIHQKITHGKESLSIKYVHSTPFQHELSDDEAQEVLLREFNAIKQREMLRATTLIGPHRDDLQFFINDINAQVYGSQGQQRTVALSIKLAEIELVKEEVGEYPLLLLDDVLSELDDERQTQLLSTIQERVQTFVTTTNIEGLNKSTRELSDIFFVNNGKISKNAFG
ncbi:DNA replication/repair protein RecF [Microaerobacter geothermalis]|uniref:DNA replication/repair protein RecF n=1 Tax=Microaerobacter geothermalis TaxID=674972 RepID=UPI001F23ECBA|nr:DNA replication/repair protein RecF [Microaerobacter geothermalis]MCF6095091.1 DNA replication/repair protein RecF [Microaerobacter geothermalis]